MEIVRIDINKELLQVLLDSSAITTDDFKVVKVEVPDFPYSDHPEWEEQYKLSAKEYRKLKELEYQLRTK